MLGWHQGAGRGGARPDVARRNSKLQGWPASLSAQVPLTHAARALVVVFSTRPSSLPKRRNRATSATFRRSRATYAGDRSAHDSRQLTPRRRGSNDNATHAGCCPLSESQVCVSAEGGAVVGTYLFSALQLCESERQRSAPQMTPCGSCCAGVGRRRAALVDGTEGGCCAAVGDGGGLFVESADVAVPRSSGLWCVVGQVLMRWGNEEITGRTIGHQIWVVLEC